MEYFHRGKFISAFEILTLQNRLMNSKGTLISVPFFLPVRVSGCGYVNYFQTTGWHLRRNSVHHFGRFPERSALTDRTGLNDTKNPIDRMEWTGRSGPSGTSIRTETYFVIHRPEMSDRTVPETQTNDSVQPRSRENSARRTFCSAGHLVGLAFRELHPLTDARDSALPFSLEHSCRERVLPAHFVLPGSGRHSLACLKMDRIAGDGLRHCHSKVYGLREDAEPRARHSLVSAAVGLPSSDPPVDAELLVAATLLRPPENFVHCCCRQAAGQQSADAALHASRFPLLAGDSQRRHRSGVHVLPVDEERPGEAIQRTALGLVLASLDALHEHCGPVHSDACRLRCPARSSESGDRAVLVC